MKRYRITENKTGQKFTVSALNEQEAKDRVKKYLNEGILDNEASDFNFNTKLNMFRDDFLHFVQNYQFARPEDGQTVQMEFQKYLEKITGK